MKLLDILVVGERLTDTKKEFITSACVGILSQLFSKEDHGSTALRKQQLYDHLRFEDLVSNTFSTELRECDERYGYLLVIGSYAAKKVTDQTTDLILTQCILPETKDWKSVRQVVISKMTVFLRLWAARTTEFKLSKVIDELEATEKEDKITWINTHIRQFKSWLYLRILSGRWPVIIFGGANEDLNIYDGTKRTRTPVKDLVLVALSDEILADEERKESIEQEVKDSGYMKPYLISLDGFMQQVKITCSCKLDKTARLAIRDD